MLLCCYTDDNNLQHFEKCNSIEDFTNKHPGITPTYVFDMKNEMNLNEQIQASEFEKYCYRFGFTPADYKKHLITKTGKECILTGFLPQNRKYTVQFVSTVDGHSYKARPDYIKDGIVRYENKKKIDF